MTSQYNSNFSRYLSRSLRDLTVAGSGGEMLSKEAGSVGSAVPVTGLMAVTVAKPAASKAASLSGSGSSVVSAIARRT